VWHNSKDMSRWFRFFIAIGLGMALGLLYGWVLNPVEFVDVTPESLRVDFKSDYVLMVAEAYRSEQDLAMAVRRLAVLGNKPPVELVRQAILFAEDPQNFGDKMAYPDADLETMRALEKALAAWNPILETPPP
jgi:hypothetical protein